MFNRSFLRRKKISNLPQTFLQYSASANNYNFGISVALSTDGTTAIIGQYGYNSFQGSAVVFTRTGKTWTEQALLTQSGGAASDNFGYSVALSSDGNTAICGVRYSGATNTGAAVVFTRSGATWTQQAVLTDSSPVADGNFGYSVALSSDGNTAICGAPYDDIGANLNQGSATVFTRSGATWTQQQVLTKTGGIAYDLFGYSVALSTDGTTAIIGTPTNGLSYLGKAIVFTLSGATWTQQAVLTYSGGSINDGFGNSVALSSDGNTAICGAPYTYVSGIGGAGIAVVFTRSGSVWTEQAALSYSAKAFNNSFGVSVKLSSDGNTAIVGQSGASSFIGNAVVFTRKNGVWLERSTLSYSAGATDDRVGISVALSNDGNIVIAGAIGIGTNVGGAIVFYNH